MGTSKISVNAWALAAMVASGCSTGEDPFLARQATVPISFETPSGDLAVGGSYDVSTDTITLSDEVIRWLQLGGATARLSVHGEDVAMHPGETTTTLPVSLDVGDAFVLTAGNETLSMTVEEAAFELPGETVEHVAAGAPDACQLQSKPFDEWSWGCGTAYVALGFGDENEVVGIKVDDALTDGKCVQAWVKYKSLEGWYRRNHSCGIYSFSEFEVIKAYAGRVEVIRAIRTNTDRTWSASQPSGNYWTLYER